MKHLTDLQLKEVNQRRRDPTDPVGRLMNAAHFLETEHRRVRRLKADHQGVSTAEFNLILLLVEHGELTPKKLASELGLTPGAMTAMLDRLEIGGFVKRQPNPKDRRSLLVNVTESTSQNSMRFYVQYFNAINAAVAKHPGLGTEDFAANMAILTKTVRSVHP